MTGKKNIFLCFDFGMRNIGLAVGQCITKTATPLKIIHAKQGVPDWDEVRKIIQEWNPDALVVGVPLNLAGEEIEIITHASQNFIASLKKHFSLEVFAADEQLTTKAARERVFEQGGYKALQKTPIDSIAAKLILEAWMMENC
jgi:putative Holliday junction resolvase